MSQLPANSGGLWAEIIKYEKGWVEKKTGYSRVDFAKIRPVSYAPGELVC
jgi:hypothetical protein